MKLRSPKLLSKAFAAVILCLLAPAFALAQGASAPQVLKVEPPSWWAGHSINPVRLLVRGRNLHGARVAATRAETESSGALVNPAGTYLFVNVRVSPMARPGAYPLTLETSAGRTTIPFTINAPLDPDKNFQGITTDDVIYLIMPDRFADGDTKNNAPADSPPEANDRKNPRAWHGGDLRGVIGRLPYLKELGVTAIWLTPFTDNWNGVNRCAEPWCPSTYYHGYHAIDYYGVEDRFGTMETLRELVERAHAAGIKVIQDQVANHIGSHHPWYTDAPLDNWFHGTPEKHHRTNFRGDFLLSPHAHPSQRAFALDGWFADDMPDMNQEEPEVARYEIQNSLWWVGMTGVDGIRQDTIQWMPRFFMRDLNTAYRREYPRAWMVGEVFDTDAVHTSFFMGGRKGWDGIDTELPTVFDFPVWDISRKVFTGKTPAAALRFILRSDALYPDASRLVTMSNNHDTRRFMSLEGATLEGAMLHMAYLTLIRGTPQLYSGEEIAMEGGDDPDNRRDFPGGFPGDRRSAFEKAGRTPTEQRMFEWTRDLLRLRREHSAIRRGALIDLSFDDDSYAFARRDADETIIIAINRAASPKDISFPANYVDARDGAHLEPLLAAKDRPAVVAGSLKLTVPARTAVAYKIVTGDK
ncbi:MAG TPA: alpha-amylase family glycosyl hydrolase [Pyrinomonadaceae bacterium]|nr:alpha-amylase family glycosyl hydrolase [Pyrinomonadaceae bacterium]